MTAPTRSPRRIKRTSGYKIPFDIEREMNALVTSGEYANRADIHTAALRFWFQYRQFDVKKALIEILQTDEGRELIRDAVKKRKLGK
jgi:Arc/MetJ-type ribon-helix-helix transcriptional regulator